MTSAAVIGCGDVSTVHFEALAGMTGVELTAVADTDPGRLAIAESAHGVAGYGDYRRMLDEVRPDVVHICTPHHRHADVALECLERGINVILEKPLAHTVADGERIAESADRSVAKIAVCFQNRYNSTVQAMHSLLASGALGRVRGASATVIWHRSAEYYRARPWRGMWETSGGGLLMNQAIHTVDLMQWLLGEVVEVQGSVATRVLGDAMEVEDTADMVLHHSDGLRSVLYATLANTVNSPVTVDVVTDTASLHLRGDLTVTYDDGRVDVIPEYKAESGGRDYWGVSHGLLIRDFYARLGETEPFWIGPREALKSLKIVQDVYARSGAHCVPFRAMRARRTRPFKLIDQVTPATSGPDWRRIK